MSLSIAVINDNIFKQILLAFLHHNAMLRNAVVPHLILLSDVSIHLSITKLQIHRVCQ